jgi:hypothetical protein
MASEREKAYHVCIPEAMHTRELIEKAQSLRRDELGRTMAVYAIIHLAVAELVAREEKKAAKAQEGGQIPVDK